MAKLQGLEVAHPAREQSQSQRRGLAAGPGRVVTGMVIGLGVRHEAQDAARRVGEASDGVGGAVGVLRELHGGHAAHRVDVAQGHKVCGLQRIKRFLVLGDDLALAMAHRGFKNVDMSISFVNTQGEAGLARSVTQRSS